MKRAKHKYLILSRETRRRNAACAKTFYESPETLFGRSTFHFAQAELTTGPATREQSLTSSALTFRMSSVTRRAFLLSLSSLSLGFPRSWESPAFPNWSPEFIDKLLTDSPWARQSTLRIELDRMQHMLEPRVLSFNQLELPQGIGLPRSGPHLPGVSWPGQRGGSMPGTRTPPSGGSGATGELFLTTRWATALPVRRAQALQHFGRIGLEDPKVIELLNAAPSEYKLEIAGFLTTVVREGAEKFAAELKDSARLIVSGRKPIRATEAEMPEHGMHLMATLRFPRLEDVQVKESHVELSASVRGMQIRERFKLSDMVYAGNLEL